MSIRQGIRQANFRDDVLWALAYRMGFNPSTDYLKDQSAAYTSFINRWVRRFWDAVDWPELTVIEQRFPINFYVDFNADIPIQTPIGKVLKVYLADPSLTPLPLDTPFKINSQGIHVGFEAGTSVWIKFITRAPTYTDVPWDATVTYNVGDIVYDPTSGNVYQSGISSNLNNPVTTGFPANTVVTVTTHGTAGVKSRAYIVVANFSNGTRSVSNPFALATTNALLDTNNYDIVAWTNVGAATYDIYRVFNEIGSTPSTVGLIHSGSTTSPYNDQGAAGDGSSVPPAIGVWTLVPFPYVLSMPVVRGAFSDALRDDGQFDKAAQEEAAAQAELAERAQSELGAAYDVLTDQQKPSPRYRVQVGAAGT